MKTWTVRSKGKAQKMVIFFTILSLILLIFLAKALFKSDVNPLSLASENIFFTVLTASPFMVPFLLVPFIKLLTAKIPGEISFRDSNVLMIYYNRRRMDYIPLDRLAYSHSSLDGSGLFDYLL